MCNNLIERGYILNDGVTKTYKSLLYKLDITEANMVCKPWGYNVNVWLKTSKSVLKMVNSN